MVWWICGFSCVIFLAGPARSKPMQKGLQGSPCNKEWTFWIFRGSTCAPKVTHLCCCAQALSRALTTGAGTLARVKSGTVICQSTDSKALAKSKEAPKGWDSGVVSCVRESNKVSEPTPGWHPSWRGAKAWVSCWDSCWKRSLLQALYKRAPTEMGRIFPLGTNRTLRLLLW